MTKNEMIAELVTLSGVRERSNARQVNEAIERMSKQTKEFIANAYNKVINGKVTATFALRVGSGIMFH